MNMAAAQTDEARKVPLLDLGAQFEPIQAEIREAIERVLSTQRFVMGPEVTGLEEAIAEYSQSKFGIGVSSGTDALLVALMALDVGPGDEVITSPYTFFATAGVVARVGARPVFCDIDPVSYNLDPAQVAAFIESRCKLEDGRLINRQTGAHVKVLMPVHLYGQVADMDPLVELARANKLRVVEDAAQAIGAEYRDGRRAGSMGDIGCFSFFPSKNLGAFGDGGMCVTNDSELAERLRVLRVHGGKPKYYHSFVGGNFRLDAIQAAILSVKLKYLDDWTAGRQSNADRYDSMLASGPAGIISTPARLDGYRHIYNQYVVRVEKRDELRAFLGDANIGTEIYYPVPLHRQECFAHLGYGEQDCPESIRAATETVAIPVYPELTADQQAYVVEQLTKFYR